MSREERRAARLRYLETCNASKRRRIRRDWYVVLCTVIPASFAFGGWFVYLGVAGGIQVDWQLTEMVDMGRVGGPLWFHLLFAFGIAGVILISSAIGLAEHLTRRPPSAAAFRKYLVEQDPVEGSTR
ncbi:MAG: hypothetical protein M0026_14495 [Nocardiopsaceae bacterium]|nr:hypothetical protein [Nocardiopsaceae bacterium]